MNRRQRRAAGRSGAKPPTGVAAGGQPTAGPGALFAAAVASHNAGTLVEAERRYRHILTLFPNHAETLSRLGGVLMAQGNIGAAIAAIERALTFAPDLFEAYGNLAQAYLTKGQIKPAVEAAGRALELNETAHGKRLFIDCVRTARFTADEGRFRRLLVRALTQDWARPRELTEPCVSLIKLNGTIRDGIARAEAAWPSRVPAEQLFGGSGLAALAQDELLCRLLECDPISDIGLERVLTAVRSAMLTMAVDERPIEQQDLQFCAALARQCFINEYIYALTESEAVGAAELQAALAARIKTGAPIPALWPVTVGCYFSLSSLAAAAALLDQPWPSAVRAVLVQQIEEPAQERRIAATIPTLTDIDGDVSRAVRQQYEENPYPRWTRANASPIGADNHRSPQRTAEVLVAGCGTGLSAIEFSRANRAARVMAIDLSLASLSYAKRMAQKLGVAEIAFAQADITGSAGLGRNFDFIDASGVLHHLADPWAGWRVLLSLLRPGGVMQVGLYSERARRNIVAARTLIAERGYRPVAQDIRRCRGDIVSATEPLLKSLLRVQDFYTTSECRDLLFHVQEHRTTLPEIKSFLDANGLTFAGFIVAAGTLRNFMARFPDPAAAADLMCWHEFETEAPDTFGAMYQFHVRKPAPRGGAAVEMPERKSDSI